MVKIRLHREDASDASDERDPYVLSMSRVPCVGEQLYADGSDEGRVKRGPGIYVVTRIGHYAGKNPPLAARVWVRQLEP